MRWLLLLALLLPACTSPRGGGGGGDDDDSVASDDDDSGLDDDDAADDDDDTVQDDDDTVQDDDDTIQDDDDTVSDDDDTTPPPLVCGWNAQSDGQGGCECLGLYDFCSNDPLEVDCCALWTQTFDVELIEAFVLPYNPATDEPWDWDGTIPTGLLDGIQDVEAVVPSATDFEDVLDAAALYAPDLLSGSTPPDPFVELVLGFSVQATSVAIDNAYDPYWGWALNLTVQPSEVFTFEFTDEDFVFDDAIGSLSMNLTTLQALAGRGPVALPGADGLYGAIFEVAPN